LRGRLKVEPLSDNPERLAAGARVFLEGEQASREITAVEASPRSAVIELAGITDRETAEGIAGRYLEVDRDPLPPGTYYWHELIGVSVRDEGGHALGEVAEVFRAGENEVYRVVGPGGETLVPALREVVIELDPAARRMVVRLDAEEVS